MPMRDFKLQLQQMTADYYKKNKEHKLSYTSELIRTTVAYTITGTLQEV
jgi:hypothetical protein